MTGAEEVSDPQLAISNTVPKLKPGLRITPFHDGTTTEERYLVEVGETFFVAGQSMRDVLTALAEEPKTLEELAAVYERQTGREISTEVLADVLAHRISDSLFDHTPDPKNKRPFILSFNLFSEPFVRPLSTALSGVFARRLVIIVSACFLLAEVFIFTHTLRAIHHPFNPWDFVVFYLSLIGITLFHELGHAAACRRFDCRHGNIGFALYVMFPAFYTDVTNAWRLPPLKRAVVDLGGIYFQAILFVALTLYVMLTGSLFALRLLWAMNLTMVWTLNPIFKMDGYWLLSDVSGLTNLHRQMRDAGVNLARKLFRRPVIWDSAPQAQGLRLKVLYVYSVLALVYFTFIAQFLFRSIEYVVHHYPQRAPYLVAMIQKAYFTGHTGAAIYGAFRLVYESIWPLILCLLVCFMVLRVARFVGRAISSVMSGYTITISMPRWVYTIAGKVGWVRH
jgi:putative peptide zinc metalloprotease protein